MKTNRRKTEVLRINQANGISESPSVKLNFGSWTHLHVCLPVWANMRKCVAILGEQVGILGEQVGILK